jgi:uncharacterized protein YggE
MDATIKGWAVPATLGVVAAAVVVGGLVADRGSSGTAVAQSPTTATSAATAATPPRTVAVDGVGTVTGTPDRLSLSMGVEVSDPTASGALVHANQKTQTLIAAFTAAGVAKADIQTAWLNVWPRYTDGTRTDGYEASNSLTITLRDVTRAGRVIDAAANAVGDGVTISGVAFGISDTSQLYAKARQLAVQQAHDRAAQLAQAAGLSVGGVVAIDESSSSGYVYPNSSASTAAASGGGTVPIEPGSQQLEIDVHVTYQLAG